MFFKKWDIVVIAGFFAAAAIAWLIYQNSFADKPAKAEIYYYAARVMTVELDTGVDKTFSIPQNEHVIFHQYKDGSICFEESGCPDKICVNAGRIGTIGQSAACLPNGIILKIVPKNGRSEDDLDAVAGN